jgi:hypothetical protein
MYQTPEEWVALYQKKGFSALDDEIEDLSDLPEGMYEALHQIYESLNDSHKREYDFDGAILWATFYKDLKAYSILLKELFPYYQKDGAFKEELLSLLFDLEDEIRDETYHFFEPLFLELEFQFPNDAFIKKFLFTYFCQIKNLEQALKYETAHEDNLMKFFLLNEAGYSKEDCLMKLTEFHQSTLSNPTPKNMSDLVEILCEVEDWFKNSTHYASQYELYCFNVFQFFPLVKKEYSFLPPYRFLDAVVAYSIQKQKQREALAIFSKVKSYKPLISFYMGELYFDLEDDLKAHQNYLIAYDYQFLVLTYTTKTALRLAYTSENLGFIDKALMFYGQGIKLAKRNKNFKNDVDELILENDFYLESLNVELRLGYGRLLLEEGKREKALPYLEYVAQQKSKELLEFTQEAKELLN